MPFDKIAAGLISLIVAMVVLVAVLTWLTFSRAHELGQREAAAVPRAETGI